MTSETSFAGEWHDRAKGEPPQIGEYLIFRAWAPFPKVESAIYSRAHGWSGSDAGRYRVTHWRFMPDPPVLEEVHA